MFTSTSNNGHTGREKSSGFTIVETLVALGIFSLILILVILVQKGGFNAFQKTQVHGDTYRMAMLTAELLKKELQYVQVTQYNVPGVLIRYRSPRFTNASEMALVASGAIDWDPQEVWLSFESDSEGNRYILRNHLGEPSKRLCSLGNEGSIVFDMKKDKLLEAQITAKVNDPGSKLKKSTYGLTMQFYLPNQNL